MTLLQLKYFISVATYLSFTRSAEELFTSQSSVSRQILQLEKELGFPLFIRSNKYVKLTPSGDILFKELSQVMSTIDNSIKRAFNASQGFDSRLVIGHLEAMSFDPFFPHKYTGFKKKYPSVQVSFESYSIGTLSEKLLKEKLDIIFTLNIELDGINDIECAPVKDSQLVLLMSSEHPLAGKPDCSFADFKDESFVFPSATAKPCEHALNILCENYNVNCNIIRVPNFESVFTYVGANAAVALMDKSFKNIHEPCYRYIDIPDQIGMLSVTMAWKKDNSNPAIALFVNHFFSDSDKKML